MQQNNRFIPRIMKLSILPLLLQCCALHLLLLCGPSTQQQCNTNLTQCLKSGGPDQRSATGAVTCFPNRTLSVTISPYDDWNDGNVVTVKYTCWNQDGIQIKNGSLWSEVAFRGAHSRTRTVESVHPGSMCRVYNCYSENECNYYSITMISTECSFKPAQTSTIPLPMVESGPSTQLVSSSLVTISTTAPARTGTQYTHNIMVSLNLATISTASLATTASFGHQMSSVSVQTSTTKLMLATPLPSTGVPKESHLVASALSVVIVSGAGVTTLLVILLCFIGYRHNHKLNITKLYGNNEVFDPFFNPIDISVATNVIPAQSLHSICEGLKSDHKSYIDPGTEDERSEILVTPISDEKSSNASIIITKEDEQLCLNQCQTDSDIDCKSIHPKPHCLSSNSENYQDHPYSAGESAIECTISEYHENDGTKMPNCQALTMVPSISTAGIRSFSTSSGYVTETEEASRTPYPPSKVIFFQEKQVGCTSKITANTKAQMSDVSEAIQTLKPTNSVEIGHGSIQMHGQQFTKPAHSDGYITDISDIDRSMKASKTPVTATYSGCSSDSGVDDIMQHFIPSDNSMDSINHDLTTDHDVLSECNLSLNPSHFQPLDSYV